MNRYFGLFFVSIFLVGITVAAASSESSPEFYVQIKVQEIFSALITRDKGDRVYSGQIKSKDGLADFKKTYGIEKEFLPVDFEKQMLIFGITDSISSRAFQFSKQEKIRSFVLDYADTGIMYDLKIPENGKKYSYLQVFILDRIDGISHIRVKNLVVNGLSIMYE
ncbi:MAG: hypothetical protein WC338_02080 [Candidatus Ratteibacteria bacterium]|jgi:hypothetical protein